MATTRTPVIALLGALVALTLLSSGCVTTAAEGEQMRQDIEALEAQQQTMLSSFREKEEEMAETVTQAKREVAELRKTLKKATEILQRNNADFGADMIALRKEIETLNGRIEELEFRLSKLEQELRLYKEDVELRFASAASEELPEEADPLLEYAREKFAAGEVKDARRALEAFRSRYTNDGRLDEVIFLLGETYFQEKKHLTAIFEYKKLLDPNIQSTKAPDAKYRIGQSLFRLGRCKKASIFFKSVVADHPDSKYVDDSRSKLETIEAGTCPEPAKSGS